MMSGRRWRMANTDRDLADGTRLVARYKKQTFVCTVEKEAIGGKLAFVLEDGRRFKSPSAAGSAVMGNIACNGWRFWSLEGEGPGTEAGAEAGRRRLVKPSRAHVVERVAQIREEMVGAGDLAPAGSECPSCGERRVDEL